MYMYMYIDNINYSRSSSSSDCNQSTERWLECELFSIESLISLSLLSDISLNTNDLICSNIWCKDSDLWSERSVNGVASPDAEPPAGVCGVLLGGIGVFVPSAIPDK